jgi:hypothetical protein
LKIGRYFPKEVRIIVGIGGGESLALFAGLECGARKKNSSIICEVCLYKGKILRHIQHYVDVENINYFL